MQKKEFKKQLTKFIGKCNKSNTTNQQLSDYLYTWLLIDNKLAPEEGWEPETIELTKESLLKTLDNFKINGKSLTDMFGDKLLADIIAHSVRS